LVQQYLVKKAGSWLVGLIWHREGETHVPGTVP